MSTGKMHSDEVNTNISLVLQLHTAQSPQQMHLPITPVPSAGTVNALYRLADDMVARLPRIPWGIEDMDKEYERLPRLASFLPLANPAPLARGEPGAGYPWRWSIYRWLDGENVSIEQMANPRQAALDLAQFGIALQGDRYRRMAAARCGG